MQLYYIRHGQSENNLLWDRTGSNRGRNTDPGLSSTGRKQAIALGDYLKNSPIKLDLPEIDPQNLNGFNLTHLYTSLMIRSVFTGSILAESLDLPLFGWIDLHETGGIFQVNYETGELLGLPGKNRDFFVNNFPKLFLPDDFIENGWWNRPFESPEFRIPRANRVLNRLLEKHGDTEDRVAFVSHGTFYQYFMMAVMGIQENSRLGFMLNNAGITRIDFLQEGTNIVYQNRVDFLPRLLIT